MASCWVSVEPPSTPPPPVTSRRSARDDAERVDALMCVEAPVLDRDESLGQIGRQVAEPDRRAAGVAAIGDAASRRRRGWRYWAGAWAPRADRSAEAGSRNRRQARRARRRPRPRAQGPNRRGGRAPSGAVCAWGSRRIATRGPFFCAGPADGRPGRREGRLRGSGFPRSGRSAARSGHASSCRLGRASLIPLAACPD